MKFSLTLPILPHPLQHEPRHLFPFLLPDDRVGPVLEFLELGDGAAASAALRAAPFIPLEVLPVQAAGDNRSSLDASFPRSSPLLPVY